MTTLTCSLASDGCISAYPPSDMVPLPALRLLFQAYVHLMEMLANVSLLLFLLGKDMEAPAFSSSYTSSGVLFTNPGTKLLGSPQPPAAWGASSPFCVLAALQC